MGSSEACGCWSRGATFPGDWGFGLLRANAGAVVLMVACLLAWFPVLWGYAVVADENWFRSVWFAEPGAAWDNRLAEWGPWRLLGWAIQVLASAHVTVAPCAALIGHIIVCVLLLRLMRAIQVPAVIALLSTLGFAVYPFGFQCLVNAMCLPMLLSTGMAIGWLVCLVVAPERVSRVAIALVGFVLALASGMVYECHAFVFVVSGLVAALLRPSGVGRAQALYGGAGAAAGAGVYLVWYGMGVYSMSRPLNPTWNPESILGAWWWQWTNVWVFEPWVSASARHRIFYDWTAGHLAVAAAEIAVLVLVLALWSSPGAEGEIDLSRRVFWRQIGAMAVIMAAGSSVFVFVGYSTDTRKKYCLLPFAALFLARSITHWPGVVRGLASHARLAVMSVVVPGVLTTWLILGVYRYEITRHTALLEHLKGMSLADVVRLRDDESTRPLWRHMDRALGFGFFDGWVIGSGIRPDAKGPLAVERAGDGARYDESSRRWIGGIGGNVP